jgi:hypothetical protein
MMVILFHRVVIGLVTILVIIGTGYDLMLQHRRRQQEAQSPGK